MRRNLNKNANFNRAVIYMTSTQKPIRYDFQKTPYRGLRQIFWSSPRRMEHAVESDDVELVRALVESGAIDLNTPAIALMSRDERMARLGDPTFRRWEDNGHSWLHLAAAAGSFEVCYELLGRGCDVNAKTFFHSTPLSMAAVQGEEEIYALLVAFGADEQNRTAVRSSIVDDVQNPTARGLIEQKLKRSVNLSAHAGKLAACQKNIIEQAIDNDVGAAQTKRRKKM